MKKRASYSLESSSVSATDHSRQTETLRTLIYLLIPIILILLVVCLGLTFLIALPPNSWPDVFPSHHSSSPHHRNFHNHHSSNLYHSPPHHVSSESSPIFTKQTNPLVKEGEIAEGAFDKETHQGIRLTSQGQAIAETKSGTVIGSTKIVVGKTIATFLGIPYAVPPVESLRFRKPIRIPDWGDDPIYAVNYSSPCVQFVPSHLILTPWISENKRGSEDCLYLNVWVPVDIDHDSNTNHKKDVPSSISEKTVMVWIHGGAFFSGSADVDLYEGSLLASLGDVIVVSFNYRLGALGFLTMPHSRQSEDEIALGNMGMYDQVLALERIRDNIGAFGGDNDNIVLFGQSAGATSAGLHLFSPLSREIPSRVILQSGSPLFPKIYFENHEEKGSIFLQEVGCSNPTSNVTVNDCLQSLTVDEIIAGHTKLFKQYKLPFFPHAGDDFLPDLPHESIHDQSNLGQQTEILIGDNEDEGSFFLHLFFPEVFPNKDISQLNLTLEDAKEYITRAYSFIPENQAQLMSQFFMMNLREGGKKEVVLKTMHDIIGDSGFVCPAVLFSELMRDYNVTVYHYLMTGRPTKSSWSSWMGSTHLDEVQFVFGAPLRDDNKNSEKISYTDSEKDWSRRLIETWTTFAKTGKVPTQFGGIDWPPYSKENPYYLDMNATHVQIKSSPHKLACNLWKIIYDSFL